MSELEQHAHANWSPQHQASTCMPRYIQPRNSAQHRVAAIALYRALLSGCASAKLPDDDQEVLRNAIRNKFRKNRHIQSTYQLGLSFKAGYETLDHLDAATAIDSPSMKTLSQLIVELPRNLARKPAPRQPPSPDPARERLECLPPERAILHVRPYAKTSGPRHVPIMASANGVPFLRLTKPQPPALSRVLRQKLQRKQNLFDRRIMLGNWWLPLAQQEDTWDAIIKDLAEQENQMDNTKDSVRWVDEVRYSERENQKAYEDHMAKDKELRARFQKIVDDETVLALKEGQTIIRGRKTRPFSVVRPPPVAGV